MSKQSPSYQSDALQKEADILNEMISVCIDSCDFYRHAEQQVNSQPIRNLFSSMANIHSEIVDSLSSEIKLRGQPPTQAGTLTGQLHQWYASAKTKFSDYSEIIFIEQLEKHENRTLEIFRSAIKNIDDKQLVHMLSSKVASIQIIYDRMKFLKSSLRTKSREN